ncbi:hypothetical protein MUG91_G77n167 [Manis pentadactyla]|nr:hypothetical protein MUG91_G77n167 [Manis pentadactyla]
MQVFVPYSLPLTSAEEGSIVPLILEELPTSGTLRGNPAESEVPRGGHQPVTRSRVKTERCLHSPNLAFLDDGS